MSSLSGLTAAFTRLTPSVRCSASARTAKAQPMTGCIRASGSTPRWLVGMGSLPKLKFGRLLGACGPVHEKVGARQRVTDASAGNVEILGIYLNADELAAELHTGDSGGAGTHEGVEDQAVR